MPEQLPIWQAVGVEPPTDLKTNGWQPGMKPSAQHMNWLFNRAYKCLEDLQNNKANQADLTNLSQTIEELEQTVTTHLDKMKQYYIVTKSVNQSVANETYTPVIFDVLRPYNGANFAQINTGSIQFLERGIYDIEITIAYDINTNGTRTLILEGKPEIVNALTSSADYTPVTKRVRIEVEAAHALGVTTRHNSGVALDIIGSATQTTIIKVANL